MEDKERALEEIKDEAYDRLVKIAEYSLQNDDQDLLPKVKIIVDKIYGLNIDEDEPGTRTKLNEIIASLKDLGDLKRVKELQP